MGEREATPAVLSDENLREEEEEQRKNEDI